MYRLLFLLFCFFQLNAFSQKLPGIEEKTSQLKKYEGYLNFYWDEEKGKVWLDINRLDTEMLYMASLPAGLGSNDLGLDRGTVRDTKIITFKKTGRKILMIEPNYRFRAVTTDTREKRATEQSFAQSVIWGFNVEAESNGHFLVDATDFLLRDAAGVISILKNQRQGNYILDKTRSAIFLDMTKNFPLNSELETTVTFVNTDGQPGNFVQSVTPSADAITLRVHHSFIQLPDNDYTPRVFDPRSSFISTSWYDYSTPVSEPIEKFFILRHRLKKKNPAAEKSEAVKPIIYYLDNGTPEPIRSALLEGARWWNQAFEAAGYINAFQVKILPDDADPMDIRYNMINWVHRSTRGWSYGNPVADPRTGEIIKGNVTLGSLRVRQDYMIAQGLLSPYENGKPANDLMLKMALARLRQLAAHEVGHTLGLMHNFASSVSDRASVMDYPHPVVTLDASGNIDLSSAYTTGIGDWDKISIRWGYSDLPENTATATLDKILSDAEKKGFLFISDRDARAPGGLHPYAHLWDNGHNAVDELKNVMKIRDKALQRFGEASIPEKTPMAFLEDVLVPVYFFHRYQLEAVTKFIGGQNYSYALRGDGQVVTAPVSKSEQQKALYAVIDCMDPHVLVIPEKIAQLIPPRPSGYEFSRELFRKRTGLAFDVLSPAETAADFPLSFLFNTQRMNRMVEYAVQNNGLSLDEMLTSLINKTWKAERRQGMEGLIQMQTEQVMLTYLLSSSIDDNASFITKASITRALSDLKTFIEARKKTASSMLSGHYQQALERMKAPDKAKPTIHAEIPPGAPIGCDEEQ